jgi:hypothetical protein
VFASLEIPLFIHVFGAEDIQASENLGVQDFLSAFIIIHNRDCPMGGPFLLNIGVISAMGVI